MNSAFGEEQNNKESYAAENAGGRVRDKALEKLLQTAIALGVLLRFIWAQKRELWYDEVLSVLLSSGQKSAYRLSQNTPIPVQDISQLLSISHDSGGLQSAKDVIKGTLGDPHPPLFYLAQHGWMRLFGNSEGALRCLMVLVSVAALWAASVVGKQILGHRGGLIFTALLALNPFFLSHSLNLRMYTPLVLWVLVSAGCLLAIAHSHLSEPSKDNVATATYSKKPSLRIWLLRLGLASSLTAGLLTHYLFAYWLFGLAALALYLDAKRWIQHGLTIGAGVGLFLPWALWGTRQQIHNRRDVLTQISAVGSPLQSAIQHSKDLAQTVANHLLLGHLTTSMEPIGQPIKPVAVAVGCGVIGFLVFCVFSLYRKRAYRILVVSVLMGVVPLLVALGIDIAADKYTLGFGWGRSVMVALPGCLMLLAAWLELYSAKWRVSLVTLVLGVYLCVNLGDFGMGGVGGRDRQMFHALSDHLVPTASPVLVALDTQAWGHVLRLAYYLQDGSNDNVSLLATKPADMPDAIASALDQTDYAQVLWLHADYPLWDKPETDEQARALSAQTERMLSRRLSSVSEARLLRGTMNLDRFVLHEYKPDYS